jgi:DNA-binding MarR family transcriptional regulator
MSVLAPRHHAMRLGWHLAPGYDMAVHGVRGVRAQASRALLHPREVVLLGWLGEQYAARADQLEVLLGCGPRSVQRVLARLRDAGLVSTYRLLVGEPVWVTPTRAGLRACGCEFKVWEPKLGLLHHTRAVNDVRLHVQARSPSSRWVCERALARERRPGEHLPDGVVLTGGQRVAVEAELTVKSERRVRAILEELTARFDLVLYFCAPAPYRQLSALAGSGGWPTLGVRALADCAAGAVGSPAGGAPSGAGE